MFTSCRLPPSIDSRVSSRSVVAQPAASPPAVPAPGLIADGVDLPQASRRTLGLRKPVRSALTGPLSTVNEGCLSELWRSPPKEVALGILQQLKEGKPGSLEAFRTQLSAQATLRPQDALQTGLLFCLWTGGTSGPAYAAMAQNVQTLCDLWKGTTAGTLLQECLKEAQDVPSGVEHDKERAACLIAGVFTAYRLFDQPTLNATAIAKAIVDGWYLAGNRIDGALKASPGSAARLSARAVRQVHKALPADHPLQDLLSDVVWKLVDSGSSRTRLTRTALTLGAVDHWVQHGVLPPKSMFAKRGMPTLPPRFALTPTLIRPVHVDPSKIEEGWRGYSQGNLGDCYGLAAWASVGSLRPEDIRARVTNLGPRDFKDPSISTLAFKLRLPEGGTAVQTIEVDNRLYFNAKTGALLFAGDREGSTTSASPGHWLAVLEKAYASVRQKDNYKNNRPDFGRLEYGWSKKTFELFYEANSVKTYTVSPANRDEQLVWLKRLIARSQPVTISSKAKHPDHAAAGVVSNHIFLIDALSDNNGNPAVRLVNLHSNNDRPFWKEHLTHPLWNQAWNHWPEPSADNPSPGKPAHKGQFWVSLEQFLQMFEVVTWVNVPGEVTTDSLARAGLNASDAIP